MSSKDLIPIDGKVIKVLPDSKFKIEPMQSGQVEILAHLSGKMRQNKIRIVLGDIVTTEVSPYDPSKGRITRRKDR